MLKFLDCCKKVNYINRSISMCRILRSTDSADSEKAKQSKRKVKETVELVTLVDVNDKILGLKPKPEAEKLALKLNLSLERVFDTKYGKVYPAYKMFSLSDLVQKEKKTSTAKVLKKLPLNSRISEHDLSLKINIIRKWLSKDCEVHVAIARNNEPVVKMKNIMNKIKEEMKNESRFVNIREKEDSIKFIILTPKQTSNKDKAKNKDEEISKDNSKEDEEHVKENNGDLKENFKNNSKEGSAVETESK